MTMGKVLNVKYELQSPEMNFCKYALNYEQTHLKYYKGNIFPFPKCCKAE